MHSSIQVCRTMNACLGADLHNYINIVLPLLSRTILAVLRKFEIKPMYCKSLQTCLSCAPPPHPPITAVIHYCVLVLYFLSQITFEGRLQNGPPYVTVSAKRLYIDGVKVKPRIGLGRDDIYEGLRDSGRFMAQFFMTPLVTERDEHDDD